MPPGISAYTCQDTPPVEDIVWSKPAPRKGEKNPPIPPRFEPLLYIPPSSPNHQNSSPKMGHSSSSLPSSPTPNPAQSLVKKANLTKSHACGDTLARGEGKRIGNDSVDIKLKKKDEPEKLHSDEGAPNSPAKGSKCKNNPTQSIDGQDENEFSLLAGHHTKRARKVRVRISRLELETE